MSTVSTKVIACGWDIWAGAEIPREKASRVRMREIHGPGRLLIWNPARKRVGRKVNGRAKHRPAQWCRNPSAAREPSMYAFRAIYDRGQKPREAILTEGLPNSESVIGTVLGLHRILYSVQPSRDKSVCVAHLLFLPLGQPTLRPDHLRLLACP